MVAFTELLLERGMLTASDLARAEEVCERTGSRLPVTLSRLGLVSESDLAAAIAAELELPLFGKRELPESCVEVEGINREFLRRHAIAPIAQVDGQLTVAMADPRDSQALGGVAFAAHPS